jgi:fucose 4-O-acetylase-like acetyltransferase
MKRVKEEGEGFRCERIDSSLNFSEIFRELVVPYVTFVISLWMYSKCLRDSPAFAEVTCH